MCIKKSVYLFFLLTVLIVIQFVLAPESSAQQPRVTTSTGDSSKVKYQISEKIPDPVEEKGKENTERTEKGKAAETEKKQPKVLPVNNPVQNLPPGSPSFMRDSLDSYIQRGMAQWQIPGLAIAVIKDGNVIFSKGYGVKEINKPDKVDENTLFLIASNTKLFTGTTLAQLDHEKKLSLNDKVTKHLPWFKLFDTTSTSLINIRDLLCHRIGLKTFQGDFTFYNSILPKDSIIWKMRYLRPSGEFRQDYGYCNSAFLVAGRILEKVTGKTWEKYVEEKILSPLGMTNSYMNTVNLAGRENVAMPYNNLYGPLSIQPIDRLDNLGPAGSMVSNIKDLSKWVMMQLDSGRYKGSQVLPWEVLQKTRDINIVTGSRRSPYYPTHFRGYGLGVNSTDYNNKQVFWHTGGAFGYVTNVCFVPEEKLGIIILTNNDNQSFFEALRYQLLDAWLGVPYTDRSNFQWGFYAQNKKATDNAVAALQARVDKKNTPPAKLDDYSGNYYNTVYGRITISRNGENLLCRFQHHPELFGIMEYMDNDEFRLKYSNAGYGIYPAKFSMKNGKPDAVEIHFNSFVESDAYLFVKDPKGIVVK